MSGRGQTGLSYHVAINMMPIVRKLCIEADRVDIKFIPRYSSACSWAKI